MNVSKSMHQRFNRRNPGQIFYFKYAFQKEVNLSEEKVLSNILLKLSFT